MIGNIWNSDIYKVFINIQHDTHIELNERALSP